MDRKSFVKKVGIAAAIAPYAHSFPSFKNNNRFFSIKKINGRHFLIDPEGEKFFSIGINHIDSAPLRYLENISIWQNKYHNSMEEWLKRNVATNLLDWGFNTMGWTRRCTVRLRKHLHALDTISAVLISKTG